MNTLKTEAKYRNLASFGGRGFLQIEVGQDGSVRRVEDDLRIVEPGERGGMFAGGLEDVWDMIDGR